MNTFWILSDKGKIMLMLTYWFSKLTIHKISWTYAAVKVNIVD